MLEHPFWHRLRELAASIRLDSLTFGPATISFHPAPRRPDSFGALLDKLERTVGRPTDVFIVTAHNVDHVTVVDEIVADHECEALEVPQRHMGGSGANTAFALAALGASVEVTGCVGADDDGPDLLESLRSAGVGVSLIQVATGPSGRTQNVVDLRGRRFLVVQPNANDAFTDLVSHDALVQAANAARIVHLSSFVDERGLVAQTRLATAVSSDVFVSLTPGSLYARRGLDRLEQLLANVDVLFLYREQLETLIDRSSARVRHSSLDLRDLLIAYFDWKAQRHVSRPQAVIVKDPLRNETRQVTERFLAVASGADSLERFFYPREIPHGAHVDAVDTTGAGDAAAAAFLYGLLQTGSMEDCLDAAFLLASFVSTAIGARTPFSQGLGRTPDTFGKLTPGTALPGATSTDRRE